MSEEPGGFLARWSRRKAASRGAVAPDALASQPQVAPTDLPALETLGANSDYRPFLEQGVPHGVQAQALRIAWASDPAIADFRGMAEYAWDFNAPGYGELSYKDDATVWLGQIVHSSARIVATGIAEASASGGSRPEPMALPVEQALTAAPSPALPAASEQPTLMIDAGLQHPGMPGPEAAVVPAVRRHGGALPA